MNQTIPSKKKSHVRDKESSKRDNKNKKQQNLYLASKRSLDIAGASIGLILTLPIFVIISVLYLFGKNKGPVFFQQKRIGRNGSVFKLYKFRSMIVNAEKVLKEDKILYQKYLDNNYKLEPEEDPRITKLGRFLRKTSLDELPQLLNVLRGEMSLVGPRPVIEDELKEYDERLEDFLSTKPGVTGYWQICGRSEVGYPERANLEFYYIDHQGFILDSKIIVNTILLVLTRKGAY
ncbi:sugar transferase [Priestia megaterium]|uniref:sugar transferase n=1 Tax=Priestia megaterium TaxID=1404 RepID=UPI001C211AF4|nr:sugar transferase [Priestia megaterium]MBU8586948.1 sugar transferase [Priestia megaterium]